MKKGELNLNQEQINAINTTNGNLLILASAGTGKTTTIVERYANLVENHDYSPHEIMMTTFTNKAAKDMIEKISKRTKKIPEYIGTMHSLFLKILRENAHLVRKNSNFTLVTDDAEKKKIIKDILNKEKIKAGADEISYIVRRISGYKNFGIRSENLSSEKDIEVDKYNEKQEELIGDEIVYINSKIENNINKLYKKYQEFLKDSNLMDFDDILLCTLEIVEKYPEIKEKYSNKFKAIMVDEAQDLNFVQMKILDNLMRDNICLIGDDCQNIFEWRGSSSELVFQFDRKHKKVILENNYRSSENIVEAVNRTIKSMKFKIDKKLKCTRNKGERIIVKGFDDIHDETEYIIQEIKKLIKKKEVFHEVAILIRTNYIGKDIERELIRNKIPCHLSKSRSFFDREEIKDVISFLNLKINPDSRVDFSRLMKILPGVGDVAINKMIDYSIEKKSSFAGILKEIDKIRVNDQAKYSARIIDEALCSNENPIESFLKCTNYDKIISNKYKNEEMKLEDKFENISLLLELFNEYSSEEEGIKNFLDSLIEMEKGEKYKNKVIISTIHSAKGLEWKHVFLACCNEKILPYYKDKLTNIKRDSELRLFYVAISRAKDNLTITYSNNQRWRFLEQSQFIELIE